MNNNLEREVDQLHAEICAGLAEPTRILILYELSERPRNVTELSNDLGLSQPLVSRHLKVLRDHGLVTVREEAQHRYYRLDATPLEVVEDWMIPFLNADFDDEDFDGDREASTVFAAWSGVDVGEEIGRRAAEGAHQARNFVEQVGKRLPRPLRRRPFRR